MAKVVMLLLQQRELHYKDTDERKFGLQNYVTDNCILWKFQVFRKYRVIRKSLRQFRPQRYSSRDGHSEMEHVNRGRDTPNFCSTLQVLDMSTLGDVTDVTKCGHIGDYRIEICRVTRGGHIEHL